MRVGSQQRLAAGPKLRGDVLSMDDREAGTACQGLGRSRPTPSGFPKSRKSEDRSPFDRLRTDRRSRTLRRVSPLPGSVPCQDSSPSIVGYYADGGQVFELTTSLIVCGLASTRPSVWPMSLRTRIDCTLYQMPRGIVVRAVPASRESPRRGWVSVRGRRSWMATPAFRCDCRAGAA